MARGMGEVPWDSMLYRYIDETSLGFDSVIGAMYVGGGIGMSGPFSVSHTHTMANSCTCRTG